MHRFPLLLVLLLLAACSLRSPAQDRATNPGQPPAIAREFRGAWIATVDNIDFPGSRPRRCAPSSTRSSPAPPNST